MPGKEGILKNVVLKGMKSGFNPYYYLKHDKKAYIENLYQNVNSLKQMKNYILLLLIIAFAPIKMVGEIPSPSIRKVQIHADNHLIETSVLVNTDKKFKINRDHFYHWLAFDKIQINEGGYSGQLLHGSYMVYNNEGKLVEQGQFTHGLKSGVWYLWDDYGNVQQEVKWKSGARNGKAYYYDAGELTRVENYKNDRLNGKVVIYNDDDVKSYRNGELREKKNSERLKTFFKQIFKKKSKAENTDTLNQVEEEEFNLVPSEQ